MAALTRQAGARLSHVRLYCVPPPGERLMLVYGDHEERVETEVRAREINRQLEVVAQMPAGLGRHARLVGALIDAGQLLQGVADDAFAEEQRDRQTSATAEFGGTLLNLGRALCRSWESNFEETGEIPRLQLGVDWPAEVVLRLPEGFAFYAVYPEAYVEAARRLKLQATPRVIGVRSIGTSLAAVVAAAVGAEPPVTVRPFGAASARQIAVDAGLQRDVLEGDAHYIIVDEGPGQSGSSFGAVADWLAGRGVPEDRIAVLPSHGGEPGAAASEARRRWWRGVQRQPADFANEWPELIGRWCGDLIGPPDGAPRDLSGGNWRHLRYASEEEWPAAVPAWERRKFLVSARAERFLVKFAGLGRIGEEKLAIARSLHRDGLVAEPIGVTHGFIVERWSEGATHLAAGEKPLTAVASYIGRRARLVPAATGSGASIDGLLSMARRNVSLEFGDRLAERLGSWTSRADMLERRIVRLRTDNKVDRHEWLHAEGGALIKTDAIDHHQAHDLIGCQDLAWDIAGAIIEFDVAQDEAEGFVAAVESWAATRVDHELLDFYLVAYAAFRLGQARLGQSMSGDGEQRRLGRSARRYAAALQHLLEGTRSATRHESLVG